MRRIFILFFLILVSPAALFAQRVSFDCRAPLSVTEGERFQIEFVLSNGGEGDNFSPPKFGGLDVLYGPSISNGQSFISVNGKSSSQQYQTYTYYVEATSAAKATISVASITANGKRYATKPVTIDILASRGGGSVSPNAQPNSGGVDAQSSVGASDVVVRMEVSKKSVYKGEAVTAQLKLYTRVGVSVVPDKFPAFNGFWAQEIPVENDEDGTRATLGGKTYNSKVIRQWLLYPQRTGLLEVEKSSYVAHIQVVVPIASPMGQMNVAQNIERKLTSPAVNVDVKALPTDGMPATFSLAVGHFTLTSTISALNMSANSAGSLKVTLKGDGDFPLIDAPKITMPEGIEGYESKMTEKVANTVAGTSGERTWEFPFVARSEGQFDIPVVEIAYFNPSTGRYNVLKSEPYKINVTRDPKAGAGAVVTTFSGDEEIKPNRTAIPQHKNDSLWLYSGSFFAIVALIVATFGALLWFLRRQISLRADVVGRKLRRANRVALARLKRAKGFMTASDRGHFFEEMLRAMWGFVGDKFAVELSDMSKDNIELQFAHRGYDDDVLAEFLSIVNDCEFARYAPLSSMDMTTIYNRALALFGKL